MFAQICKLSSTFGYIREMPSRSDRILISSDQIQQRVRDMGAEIEKDYPEGPFT